MARLRFFAGKGGVGKTTCATAYAVHTAHAGDRTLLISTDPAPSVGDALRQRLSSSPRRVAGTRRLQAVEIDATAALDRWLTPRRAAFESIVLRGSWLDEHDVRALLRQSMPGIDEIAALMEIGRYARMLRYDSIVVDTAPTGHTLRMLAMPRLLETLAQLFDEMQNKHRALVTALRGSWTPEEPDERISEMSSEARYLSALLRDPEPTAFSWITLPEPMAVAETVDGIKELTSLGIAIRRLVINRMTPAANQPCGWCRKRRTLEHAAIRPLFTEAPNPIDIAAVAARPTEPRGPAALLKIAREMDRPVRLRPFRSSSTDLLIGQPALPGSPVTLTHAGVSLLIFGGKGGVGKTTCAAAAAVEAAAVQPDRSVLLLSTDPAHSLGDVLGMPLGNDPRPVAGAPSNLRARELDAGAELEAIKSRYRDAIDVLFARFGRDSAIRVTDDRQSLRDLMELAPPGLDELMAIVEVSDALETETGRPLLVVDTAPTGHALRLLEMPALVHHWVKALMSIVLKYQAVAPAGDLGALLLQMSRGLGRLRALLVDPSRTAFVMVTRPAVLPVAETERFLQRIERLEIPVAAVLVNAVGAGRCSQCTVARREQRRAMTALRRSRRTAAPAFVLAPAALPPPSGPAALREWRRLWKSQQSGISSPAWRDVPVRQRVRRTRTK